MRYTVWLLVALALSTCAFTYYRAKQAVGVISSYLEIIPVSVSWKTRRSNGGTMTVTVTQEENESLESFNARVTAAEELFPPIET